MPARHEAILNKLSEENAAWVLGAGDEMPRNGDVHYPFRACSYFLYATGISETPEAVALFLPKPMAGVSSVLFWPEHDEEQARWQGPQLSAKAACEQYGFDAVHDLNDLDAQLARYLASVPRVYRTGDSLELMALECVDTNDWETDVSVLEHLRAQKEAHERVLIQKAIDISVIAHKAVMKACRHSAFEYELEAVFVGECLSNGARAQAYSPIVAAGSNGGVLHYHRNADPLSKGDMLLIDAGAEWCGYAADLTRTIPINGRFSEAQQRVYEWVLKAQCAVIDAIRPGVTLSSLQTLTQSILEEALLDLGLCHNAAKAKAALPLYYPHGIGHSLGLDVHDVGVSRDTPLREGMVVTVEPGLYFGDDAAIPERYRNIHVRIEDDVWVGAEGADVLSAALPKTVDAIEQLMNA